MNDARINHKWRGSLIEVAKTVSRYRARSKIKTSQPTLHFPQSVLTSSEAFWLAALALLTALVFFANKILLFTEFNNWALVAYATDFIKASATDKYVIRLLNTPNALFTLIYIYLRVVFPFLNSYTLYKLILLACVTLNIYLLIRLSQYKNAYLILLPIIFGYVLVGGMTHYYIALTLFFLALLLYESGRNSPLKTFALALLSYHAHFMGFFSLMLLVLYKEGVRKAILYSVIPMILFVSYKYQYSDAYHIGFNYDLENHILSIRRLLLPSMTDDNSNLYILLFSGLLNLLFLSFVTYMLFARYFIPQDQKAFALMLGLLVIYLLVPATVSGSGSNIHERLIVPFLAIAIHLTKEKPLDRRPIVLFTGLLLVNIWLYHFYYGVKGPDYRNPLLNKEATGSFMNAAQDILNGKPVDAIDVKVFTTGLIGIKQ